MTESLVLLKKNKEIINTVHWFVTRDINIFQMVTALEGILLELFLYESGILGFTKC